MGERRRGVRTVTVLGLLLLLALAALGASSSWGRLVSIMPAEPKPVESPALPSPSPSMSPSPPYNPLGELPDVPPREIPEWVAELAVALAIAAGVALVAWIAAMAYRAARAPGLRRAAAAAGTAVEVPEIDEEEVAVSLAETLARLRSGVAVDDAVVECWRRLETIAAGSGIARAATQTSQEFTVAILAHAVVDDSALAELAALYRRALFSEHVLSEADRDAAIRCVERLADQLGAQHAG